MQWTDGAVRWFGFFYTGKMSAIYIVEERMQTANYLSSCRFGVYFSKKSVKGSKIYTNASYCFLEIKVIVNIIG